MKRVIALVSMAVVGTVLTTGDLRAQGTPQSITEKRVDVVQLATGYRASKINGAAVYNRNKDKIGTIDDLIVSPTDRVPYVILSVGGFLGMGTRLVAVPFSSLTGRSLSEECLSRRPPVCDAPIRLLGNDAIVKERAAGLARRAVLHGAESRVRSAPWPLY